MPDQNSAADEHALLEEITAPLAALPKDPVPIVSDVDFPVVLRGYDRMAVDAYVRRTSQLVAELQAARSPEAAVRRALEQVGEQISGILQRSHDTAAQITAQSRTEAEDRLEVARREAERLVADARDRVRELDVDTDRIWSERQRIVDDARQLSEDLLRLADNAAERFPAASGDTGEALATEGDAGGEAPLPFGEPRLQAEEPEVGPGNDGLPAPEPELDAEPPENGAQDPEPTMAFEPLPEHPAEGLDPGEVPGRP